MEAAVADGNEQEDIKSGDVASVLDTASTIVEAEYRVPYLAQATMEPMNCTAFVHDGGCKLWAGSQNPLDF